MKRCLNCFAEYGAEFEICPRCGQIEGRAQDTPRALAAGTVLQGRYLVGFVRTADAASMLYAGFDLLQEQKVLIREFFPGMYCTRSAGEDSLTCFAGEKTRRFRECREKFCAAAENLRQIPEKRNLVRILDILRHENRTSYLILEDLEGETLAACLQRTPKLPFNEARRIELAVLDALQQIHAENLLHGCVKPDKIFLTKEGEIKLLDSCAECAVMDEKQDDMSTVLSDCYMAEETYRGAEQCGPWTDVYAAAAVMYRMLTGKTPAAAAERRRKDMLSLPGAKGRLAVNIRNAVLSALSVDPKARTQSAAQFAQELRGEKKAVYRKTRAQKSRRIGSVPIAVTLLTTLLLLAAAAFLVLMKLDYIPVGFSEAGGFELKENQIRVPNIINKSLEEAEVLLKERGLTLRIADSEPSETIPQDVVLSQAMRSGTLTTVGRTIEVVVSAGPEQSAPDNAESVTMPSVLHIPQERAETILAELGLKVEIQMGQSEIESGGNVMVQEPAQNTVLQKGDTVLLTICEQQPPQIIALRVAKAPKKTSYTVGAALDTTGLVMEAEYDDGTVQTITEGFTCSPTRLNKSGRGLAVTVTYEGKTAQFKVNVREKKLNETPEASPSPTVVPTGTPEPSWGSSGDNKHTPMPVPTQTENLETSTSTPLPSQSPTETTETPTPSTPSESPATPVPPETITPSEPPKPTTPSKPESPVTPEITDTTTPTEGSTSSETAETTNQP